MKVIDARFVTSAASRAAGWPDEGPPEVAIAGRSNVGKSTLLAALMKRRGLVRVSATPGRTRLINFFAVEIEPRPGERRELRLVDLPGYGYAKVSKAEREEWLPFVDQYLSGREALRALILLCDARRPPDRDEREIAAYVAARKIAVLPVMTKADKLAKHARKPALQALERALGRAAVAVSGTTGEGIDPLWQRLWTAVAPHPEGDPV